VKRRLFTFLSALSLLLCLATCSVWVWARLAAPRWPVDWFVIADRHSYGVATEAGEVIGFLQREGAEYCDGDPGDVLFDRWGFRYYRITSGGMRRLNLVLPYWAIASVAAVLPLAWGGRRVRDRGRRRTGRCVACGYDLRATPDRCPECGREDSGRGEKGWRFEHG
jgi:hypothetical protein